MQHLDQDGLESVATSAAVPVCINLYRASAYPQKHVDDGPLALTSVFLLLNMHSRLRLCSAWPIASTARICSLSTYLAVKLVVRLTSALLHTLRHCTSRAT